ncbi:ABC transporter ATP-binding protein [Tissierella praeacuta]|uniref:Branched-chain amino acid transport system ATP-binding protein n=1 Tax=Tissierella praeacuta DSM 18095 TaxID=1123404 RepID=A0A1M4YWB7_9FIRM|nr:ABC transporter ATP-binding protein [Tissierella praeacuta]MBU5257370.1 ABC transporter ATP-binding protein [Tissierella praeacuta]TCU65621.1 branched-chain amino acid transport system ATP-binding protein [Tissierella praeacuta]SHF09626.1 branched-chain amino acid transport system ATP-binding protein [Tissierella praeacuta DSM 18095]SUP00739.1 LIV-I protein F [Tissierella praeacuta]
MLELSNVNVYYGAIHALKNISLKIEKGEIVTLIGANGAGKSTTLKAISGMEKPKSGEIKLNGENLNDLNAPDIVKLGISHVPEGRRIFSKMSVMENLEMGAYIRNDKEEIKKDFDKVFSLFPRLLERKEQMAGTLSGGEQQMLAIGRALMSRPNLLLLDEPSMGLAPIIVKEIFSIIKNINEDGTTILLVEQNANMALNAADRAYIIRNGEIEIEGNAKKLVADERVKKAYLEG